MIPACAREPMWAKSTARDRLRVWLAYLLIFWIMDFFLHPSALTAMDCSTASRPGNLTHDLAILSGRRVRPRHERKNASGNLQLKVNFLKGKCDAKFIPGVDGQYSQLPKTFPWAPSLVLFSCKA